MKLTSPIIIRNNTYSAQSKGCWLSFQIRYTKIYFTRFWNPKSDYQGISIDLWAPVHYPNTEYRCIGFKIVNCNKIQRELERKRSTYEDFYK